MSQREHELQKAQAKYDTRQSYVDRLAGKRIASICPENAAAIIQRANHNKAVIDTKAEAAQVFKFMRDQRMDQVVTETDMLPAHHRMTRRGLFVLRITGRVSAQIQVFSCEQRLRSYC